MSNKRLKEMEEEYQMLMIGSNGAQNEEIRNLGRKIDDEKEFIESEEILKKGVNKNETIRN